MDVALIAAVAENGVIGVNGGIPWHYSDDLKRFKRKTTGHPVILGRRTYESIIDRLGEPLPKRHSIVLSTSLSEPDVPQPCGKKTAVTLARDTDQALDIAERLLEGNSNNTVYVAGGESVYEAFVSRADRLELTEIHKEYEGDTYFPEWPPDEQRWSERERVENGEISFVTLESETHQLTENDC